MIRQVDYRWCGAAGTVRFMRSVTLDGRVPTELSSTQIQARATQLGMEGVLPEPVTMNRVCVESGFTRMYSFLKYEYDPGGTFRRCGQRGTSYFDGTNWGTTSSCGFIGRLVCY